MTSILLITSCTEEIQPAHNTAEVFWVENTGAQMPVWVEGNTASNNFILILHGGPAGSGATGYNLNDAFSVPLEERFAVAYWDQRGSGTAKGNYTSSSLNLEQFVEDLDKVVDVMKYRYGQDINLYLLGNSWGGFLGNAYLIDETRQAKIAGWIAVDGQHDFEQGLEYAVEQMTNIAEEQISQGNDVDYWNNRLMDIQNANIKNPSPSDHSYLNRLAYRMEYKLENTGVLTRGFQLEQGEGFDYFFLSPYNPITSNINSNQTNSIMWNQITPMSLTNDLHRISLPSLILWGKYDMVTPTQLGIDQYHLISTSDSEKELVILETSGHQALKHQPSKVVSHIISFIDNN